MVDLLIGIGILTILVGIAMIPGGALGIAAAAGAVVSGILIIALARILQGVEATARQAAVAAAQARAAAGLGAPAGGGRAMTIGGFPAVQVGGRRGLVVVRTTAGDLWFANATEAEMQLRPNPNHSGR